MLFTVLHLFEVLDVLKGFLKFENAEKIKFKLELSFLYMPTSPSFSCHN
jgi:hypothetical protein